MSERFSTLIQQHVYPTRKEIYIENGTSSSYENLRDIGSSIVEAMISIDNVFDPLQRRKIDIFAKYCGANIQRLNFRKVIPSERLKKQFQPIFSQLKELEWSVYDNHRYQIHLPELCTRLENLKIRNFINGNTARNGIDIGIQHWPSLKIVVLKRSAFLFGIRSEAPFF